MAISDRRLLAGRTFDQWARELAEAGVDALQVREKDLGDLELWELARRARRSAGALEVLINGRADVALAADCQGVHLPSDGVPVAALRRRFGDRPIVGRSTHRLEEVAAAAREGADYVTFGPVYATPGKAIYGEPPGLAGLRAAVAVGIPVIALGGVGPRQVAEVAAAGAAGIAGIRAFHDGDSLRRLVAAVRSAWPPGPAATGRSG